MSIGAGFGSSAFIVPTIPGAAAPDDGKGCYVEGRVAEGEPMSWMSHSRSADLRDRCSERTLTAPSLCRR